VEALARIAATTIHSNYAFFRKAQKQWVRGTFNLFTVFFRGQDLPNGQVADTTYFFLHPFDVESLNSFYVKPLDYAYLRQLANPLTQRLYEVLGLRFRGLRNSAYTRYEYEHLCQTLPITPQRSLKDAKKVLAPHHDRLYKTGFLAKVEWHARQSVKPWEVFYWPGSKAQEEMQRAREFPQPQFSLTDSDGEEESFQIQDLLDQIRDEIQDPRWEQSLPFYRRAIQDLGSDHVYARLAETRGASREGKIRKSKAGVSANLLDGCAPCNLPHDSRRAGIGLGGSAAHLVRREEERWRDGQAEGLGRLQGDAQREPHDLLHRQGARFRPRSKVIPAGSYPAGPLMQARAVRHAPAKLGPCPVQV
jgi:hypothetical protein